MKREELITILALNHLIIIMVLEEEIILIMNCFIPIL